MMIKVTIVFFLLGIILFLSGIYGFNSMDPWNIRLQYIIQTLLGIVLFMGSFQFKEED